MVLDPSIQASLQRPSSVISENIAAGGDLSAGMESSILVASSRNSEIIEEIIEVEDDPSPGMESSIPVASSRNSEIIEEIIEVEDDPSPGMEPSLQTTSSMLDPAEDERSSETGSTSSPEMEVNPFTRELLATKYLCFNDLRNHYSKLDKKLKDGLQEEAIYAFLDHDNMTEAKKKVQEVFELFEAIEFVFWKWKQLISAFKILGIRCEPNLYTNYCRIDIYYFLIIHALSYAIKLRKNPSIGLPPSDSLIVANLSKYFEATDFMVFLINKVQEEENIMYPSLTIQENKTLVTKCVHKYEEETISTFICLVVNDEDEEAEDLFKSLLKHVKPSDIINRGRVYNYALQKAQELLEVYKCLSSPSLSQRFKDQCNDRLNGLPMEYDNQVEVQIKVQKFLVDLYLRDANLKQKIDWEFVEQHDYPYLIQCVWECHKNMVSNWTPLQLQYVFTSSAAIVGGQDIMEHILEAWPKLDVNASYKGVAALHVAAFKGNEEVIKFLFKRKGFDINVRTGRLFTTDNVKKFLKCKTAKFDDTAFNKGVLKCKDESLSCAIALKDHEEFIKDLLLQREIEMSSDGDLDAKKFINKNLSLEKKWNKNRWKLPTYQTALHIATTQVDTKVVKLLCDAPELHQQKLRCHEEDEEDRTPVDIICRRLNKVGKDFESSGIEKILLSKHDVQNGIDRLYRNRQVLVDAVNTILVGAALIASVTFAGWLQPPFGYAQYYDLAMPDPAPPGTYDSYLAVRGNLGVKAFALFNSLSFFFAIATVIVGADAAFPTRAYQYIGHEIETMDLLLQRAITFLIISLVSVFGAFSSAAIVILPPSLFFRKDLVLSIIIGGGICGYVLWQLLSRHSTRVRKLNAYIRHIIKFTDVF